MGFTVHTPLLSLQLFTLFMTFYELLEKELCTKCHNQAKKIVSADLGHVSAIFIAKDLLLLLGGSKTSGH